MREQAGGTVYLSVYLVARPEALRPAARPTRITEAFEDAVRAGGWPHDVGDDPAFFCSKLLARDGGSLSWGICRRDLRNALKPGDVIVFLGFERRGDGLVDYRLPARPR